MTATPPQPAPICKGDYTNASHDYWTCECGATWWNHCQLRKVQKAPPQPAPTPKDVANASLWLYAFILDNPKHEQARHHAVTFESVIRSRDELVARLAEKERELAEAKADGTRWLTEKYNAQAALKAALDNADEAIRYSETAVAALKATLEDAERYRYVRDSAYAFEIMRQGYRSICPTDTKILRAQKIDAAIDTALARQGREG